MSNMSYCRFENTAPDLHDCYEHMDDNVDDLHPDEAAARLRIIRLAKMIADEFGDEVS